ncbi:hypothetical protein, partial [Phlomis mottle virus]
DSKPSSLLPGDIKELEALCDLLCFLKVDFCNRGLPTEISSGIVNPIINEVRKTGRQEEQRARRYNGTSRSAIKRRSSILGHCRKCGKLSHEGACSANQTRSNSEFYEIIHMGTNRWLTENVRYMRKGSYVRDATLSLINRASQ